MGNKLRLLVAFLAFAATLMLILSATDDINQIKFPEKTSKQKLAIYGVYSATFLLFTAALLNLAISFDDWRG